VINRDTALGEQLLDIVVRQAVAQIPAHRHCDHLRREPEPANAHNEPEEVTGSASQSRPFAQRDSARQETGGVVVFAFVLVGLYLFVHVASLATGGKALPLGSPLLGS
jgi:hypothetical protein